MIADDWIDAEDLDDSPSSWFSQEDAEKVFKKIPDSWVTHLLICSLKDTGISPMRRGERQFHCLTKAQKAPNVVKMCPRKKYRCKLLTLKGLKLFYLLLMLAILIML